MPSRIWLQIPITQQNLRTQAVNSFDVGFIALTEKSFELSVVWNEKMYNDFQLEDVYDSDVHRHNKPIQDKVEFGIMVYLIQHMIEKERYEPKHKTSILKTCKFLKLFNFLTYRKRHLEWFNKQEPKLDLILDRTYTYDTEEALKNDLKKQFENTIEASMIFENKFVKLIEWCHNKHDVSFGYAAVLFYQCGRALKISTNTDFYYWGGMKAVPKKCSHTIEIDDSGDGFEAIRNYELSYDKENMYLHTPDKTKIECKFKQLDLCL